MEVGIGKALFRHLGGDMFISPHRMGFLCYYIAKQALSIPLEFFVAQQTKGMFAEEPEIEGDSLKDQFAKRGIKPISSTDELCKKIFNFAVTLAIFIPATLAGREFISHLGYHHLSMVTTPMLILIRDEASSMLFMGLLSHILGSIIQ